jgi:UDP-2-acetamido-2,6-beta-L-arabino-hexul-4-ose reductase
MHLEPLEKKTDERGTLVEAFPFKPGQVNAIIINPGESRGGHYHLRKTEAFLVVLGSAELAVKNRATGDVLKAEVSGMKPIRATIVPNHTHLITAGPDGCICLVWCDEDFHASDLDTYWEEL